jgi:hypothetical protein
MTGHVRLAFDPSLTGLRSLSSTLPASGRMEDPDTDREEWEMKLKALIATGVVALSALIPVTTAAAHSTTWSTTAQSAANALAGSTLTWTNDVPDYVTSAYCTGTGSSYWKNGKRFFKHFRCYVETADNEAFFVRFHVVGDHRWSYDFLRYA